MFNWFRKKKEETKEDISNTDISTFITTYIADNEIICSLGCKEGEEGLFAELFIKLNYGLLSSSLSNHIVDAFGQERGIEILKHMRDYFNYLSNELQNTKNNKSEVPVVLASKAFQDEDSEITEE